MFKSIACFLIEVLAVLLGFRPRAGETVTCVVQGFPPLSVLKVKGAFAGLIGLLNHTSLPISEALLLDNIRSVHTFGMTFPIDIIFLDKKNSVLKIERCCPPAQKVRGPFKTKSILEMAAGGASVHGIALGTQLDFVSTKMR